MPAPITPPTLPFYPSDHVSTPKKNGIVIGVRGDAVQVVYDDGLSDIYHPSHLTLKARTIDPSIYTPVVSN